MPTGPRFLLRFDDICPTMNWSVWREVEAAVLDAGISPLIAVVPDNRDPVLQVDAPAVDFWDRVRGWQARGWSIALHGYQHRYLTKKSGLIGLNRFSEFAGLPEPVQAEKIRAGLAVFERERVRADAWIAPAHSFDRATLRVLARHGPHVISDGFARWPFVDGLGLFWVPQQLWWFAPCGSGVWSICLHCNPWTRQDIERFRRDLTVYRSSISSLPEVLLQFQGRQRALADILYAAVYGRAMRSRNGVVRRLGSILCRK